MSAVALQQVPVIRKSRKHKRTTGNAVPFHDLVRAAEAALQAFDQTTVDARPHSRINNMKG